jgi:hypothetical protein
MTGFFSASGDSWSFTRFVAAGDAGSSVALRLVSRPGKLASYKPGARANLPAILTSRPTTVLLAPGAQSFQKCSRPTWRFEKHPLRPGSLANGGGEWSVLDSRFLRKGGHLAGNSSARFTLGRIGDKTSMGHDFRSEAPASSWELQSCLRELHIFHHATQPMTI